MLVKRTNVKVFTIKFVGTRPSPYKKKNLPGRGLIKVEKRWYSTLSVCFLNQKNSIYIVQNSSPKTHYISTYVYIFQCCLLLSSNKNSVYVLNFP